MKTLNKLSNFIRANWKSLNVQRKLTSIFGGTLLSVFLVNVVLFANINVMINQVEQIYVSNLTLNGLLTALDEVQNSMTDYLNTKSSDSLDAYYRSNQAYNDLLRELNTAVKDDEMLILEKNIYNLSATYLSKVEKTINAKRGRDVEHYSNYYEDACKRYEVIETYIYSLNNEKFISNNKNYEALLSSLHLIEVINLVLLVAASILGILLAFAITGSIMQPLRELSKAAEEVSNSNFEVEITPEDSNDEIGILSRTFEQMIISIRKYIAQTKENIEKENEMKARELKMEGQMKDAELKYLQAQINPHFLFNTLNAGAQLAMLEGADRTTLFIEHMADFFRYNIKKLNEDTTLAEEISLVDSYIYILNVRFSGDIHFQKNIEDGLGDIRVPSMILQPIVENAVNYGIRDLERDGFIELSCARKDNYVEISVWDNGKGIEKEKIDQILSGEYVSEKTAAGSNGIGLGNVISRLELYFGETGLLNIVSEGIGMGTEVIISIPVEANVLD